MKDKTMKFLKKSAALWLAAGVISLTGCASTHTGDTQSDQLIRWDQVVFQDQLRIKLDWTKPMTPGPHPTIVLHPGLDSDARQIRTVADDLAREGYLVVAVHYKRKINDSFQKTLLPLREISDFTAAVDVIRQNPLVDPHRIAALGFSLGGAHSFLMAAKSPHIKAVATYYPMTNFIAWAAEKQESLIGRIIIRFVRWNFNAEADHHNDSYHLDLLQSYSPVNHTDSINAPVLIVHGENDKIAPLDHAKELHQLLLNNTQTDVRFMLVENAPHAFRFDYSDSAEQSWQYTKAWLEKNLIPQALAQNDLESNGS
jgi:dipeptidyl aminopeptidase/acylaminoacyl peptidase